MRVPESLTRARVLTLRFKDVLTQMRLCITSVGEKYDQELQGENNDKL